ncbi:MAG: bestrophin family protein [Opitutaceae bacterium]
MVEYNPKRWSPQLLAVKGSIAPKILVRVALVVLWSAGVVLIHKHIHHLEIPPTVHTLVGLALGLLLVFRTNSSYERFWEGRKAWGRIINTTRNLARTATTLLKTQRPTLELILLWTAAYPYSAMNSLRKVKGLGPLEPRLPPAAVAEVLAARHVPLAVAQQISLQFARHRSDGTFAERCIIYLDDMVRRLVDEIGECERIQNTPLPFAYVVHLRRALVLYLTTLPFVLVDPFGWLTTVCMLLISYVLLGIDEIGVEIENPFGMDSNDLPIESFCSGIEQVILEQIPPVPAASPAATPAAGTTAGV